MSRAVRNTVSKPPAFAARLQSWGEAIALIGEDGLAVSYAQLAAMADEFSRRLPDKVRLLAVEARNRPESIVAYLAALRSGVPVVMYAGGAEAGRIFARCEPDARYVFHEPDGTWDLQVKPTRWRQRPHPELALLLSTSGSTGSPKLVRLGAAALQANAQSIGTYLGLTASDRAVTSLPLSYSYGLSVLNSHLAVGASIVLTDLSVSDPGFRALLARHGVTNLAGVPYSYELMERSGLLADLPASLTTLTQAGGRMQPELIARVAEQAKKTNARLFVMYGQTEATARIAYLPPELLARHLGAIGGAIPGGELWLEDDEGARVRDGGPGELVYRGPNVMMGYATTRSEMAAPPGPPVLHTGDLAVEVEPGIFRITGRKARFVKPFGLRVGLDDLEARCRDAGAEVFAAGDDALIVIAAASPDSLDIARGALSDLTLPADVFEFVLISETPRLPGGKVDYQALLRLARAARDTGSAARISPIDAVRRLYRKLARNGPLQESDSFETLGGDSLSYVQCSLMIEDALGEAPEGWERLPLSRLSEMARSHARAARRRLHRTVTLESDIVVRCLAIMLILFQHALNGLQGGADVLMVLAGFSWSRFQRSRLLAGESAAAFIDFS